MNSVFDGFPTTKRKAALRKFLTDAKDEYAKLPMDGTAIDIDLSKLVHRILVARQMLYRTRIQFITWHDHASKLTNQDLQPDTQEPAPKKKRRRRKKKKCSLTKDKPEPLVSDEAKRMTAKRKLYAQTNVV